MLIRLSNYLESQLLQPKQENTSAQIYYSNITIPHVLHVNMDSKFTDLQEMVQSTKSRWINIGGLTKLIP